MIVSRFIARVNRIDRRAKTNFALGEIVILRFHSRFKIFEFSGCVGDHQVFYLELHFAMRCVDHPFVCCHIFHFGCNRCLIELQGNFNCEE